MSRKHARERVKRRMSDYFTVSARSIRAWRKPIMARYWVMSTRRRRKALEARMSRPMRRFIRQHPELLA